MEQHLKQRIVGACVITSLAAIFLPMLFDDPVYETERQIHQLKIPPKPDVLAKAELSKTPSSKEDVLAYQSDKQTIENSSDSTKKQNLSNWYIQAGYFSQQENAEVLHQKLLDQGFTALLSQEENDDGVRYRVKVGPVDSKESALTTKESLDKKNKNIKSYIYKESRRLFL